MTKICEMTGVREYGDGDPVELHIDDVSGHLIVVASNEGGHCATYVDLNDLLKWASAGPAQNAVVSVLNGTDTGRYSAGP